MIPRALLFASLIPLSALAQVQVFVLNGTTQTAVGSSLPVGTATVGDTIETQFRVKNTGSTEVPLTVSLSSDGGFVIQCIPSPGVPPGLESAFCIDFTPLLLGNYSAGLSVNGISILLTGNSLPDATVTLSGTTTPLLYGATIDFGSVVVHQSQPETFLLSNSYSSSLTVSSVSVSGSAFGGPSGLKLPAQIGPGESVPFQVSFTPQSGTPYQGTLTIDGRVFTLTGQGLDPPLPSASIAFVSSVAASAQQNSISIPLASASQVSGNGTLTMDFQPSVAGVTNDAAIQFLSGPLRKATVSISIGDTVAMIGGLPSISFQTGTTAGTITFTLTLPNGTQQSSLIIPPSAINLDTATAVREFGALDVAFSGFDNTYSASQLAFTFYDLKGNALPQGVINVDSSTAFQQYFNTTQAGGSFALLATFLVKGDTSQIGFVTAQVTSSIGATTAPQIPIGN